MGNEWVESDDEAMNVIEDVLQIIFGLVGTLKGFSVRM
jgi:hypothetical protein